MFTCISVTKHWYKMTKRTPRVREALVQSDQAHTAGARSVGTKWPSAHRGCAKHWYKVTKRTPRVREALVQNDKLHTAGTRSINWYKVTKRTLRIHEALVQSDKAQSEGTYLRVTRSLPLHKMFNLCSSRSLQWYSLWVRVLGYHGHKSLLPQKTIYWYRVTIHLFVLPFTL